MSEPLQSAKLISHPAQRVQQMLWMLFCMAVFGGLVGLLAIQASGTLILALGVVALLILACFMIWFSQVSSVLLLVALFLPVEMIPGMSEIYGDLDMTTPLLLIALLYIGISALKTNRILVRRTPIDFAIVMFIVAQLTVLIVSPWRLETLASYIKYSKVFVLFYLLVTYFQSRRVIVMAIRVHISSAVLVALYGLVAFVLYVVTGQPIWGLGVSWGYLPRIYGTMRDQNIFAAYMIAPLLLLVSAFLLSRSKLTKFGVIGAVGIILLAVLLSWSRSGFLGLGVAGLTYLLLNRQYVGRISLRLLPVGIGVLLVIGIAANTMGYSPALLLDRFSGNAYGTDQSDQLHYYVAKLGWEVFRENPLGVGRWNLLRYVGTVSGETKSYFMGSHRMNEVGEVAGVYQAWPLHSSWLEVLVSEGIIGFTAFLLIVVTTIRYGVLAARWTSDFALQLLLKSYVAGFVGVLASAVFYTFDWMYFFWFNIGMIMVLSLYIFSTERHVDAL